MMNRGENSDNIPSDLILEIFSRLPAKSVARFRCVSKQWGSMLSRPYFIDLFLTISSARPRPLFVVQGEGESLLFLSPQHPYGKSSLVLPADFHLKFSEYTKKYDCSYVSGLIHFHKMWINVDKDEVSVICNPSTGQYAILPELRTDKDSTSFLGFDPIDKQFKVLMMSYKSYGHSVHHILTLGTDKVRWRKIQCPFGHYPPCKIGKCINGVLYYLAQHFHSSSDRRSFVLVCFDVRTEKFKFLVDPKCLPRGWGYGSKMINYKGKLAVIFLKNHPDSRIRIRNLCMWVLGDLEKQDQMSTYIVYTLPENKVLDTYSIFVVGGTSTDEILLSNFYTSKPFYVFYFNPEKNTLQCVEIHGNHEVVEDRRCVYAIADHVEDLKFNIMETTYTATSISPPEQSTSTSSSEHINIIQ